MTQRNDSEQAFPRAGFSGPVGFGKPEDGMSLRQYAAIKLRVPDSGTDWLDDMIRRSLRTDLAGKAMHALITEPPWLEGGQALVNILGQPIEDFDVSERYAYVAYVLADSMLAARERS